MISTRKRRRTERIKEHTASSLRSVYKKLCDGMLRESDVTMEGKHPLLRWMIIACEKRSSQAVCTGGAFARMSSVLDKVEHQNAHYTLISYDKLMDMEAEAAAWVFSNDASRPVLTYLTFFFLRHRGLCEIRDVARPQSAKQEPCEWLKEKNLTRSLVVPDVRKLALELFTRCELRPGEPEWVSSMNALTECSSSTILAIVRTTEFVDSARHCIMYDNLLTVHKRKMLAYIVLAIVDIRLRNRIQLPWVDKCVLFASQLPPTLEHSPWPRLVVTAGEMYSVYKNIVQSSNCAIQAFMVWHGMCLQHCDGVIDGRWNVRDYTI